MGWRDVYVLVPVPADKLVRDLGEAMAQRYNVPAARCLCLPHQVNQRLNGFTSYQQGDLSGVDIETKLIICAHGSSRAVGGNNPQQLAGELQWLGVKLVGLIAFKCCEVGKRDFLEQLRAELWRHQISFGYMIAYKGGSWLESAGRMRGLFFGKVPTRIVKGDAHVAIPDDRYLKLEERLHH
jgi:hypothetical protein